MIELALQIGPGVQLKHCRSFLPDGAGLEIRRSLAVADSLDHHQESSSYV